MSVENQKNEFWKFHMLSLKGLVFFGLMVLAYLHVNHDKLKRDPYQNSVQIIKTEDNNGQILNLRPGLTQYQHSAKPIKADGSGGQIIELRPGLTLP